LSDTSSSNAAAAVRSQRQLGRGVDAAVGGERLGGPGSGSGGRVGLRQSTPDPEEVRQRRLAFLDKMDKKADGN
jgi:hypothetical protein